jgi:hypothetical protein
MQASEQDEIKSDMDQPLPVIQDFDTGDKFLIYMTDDGVKVELRVEDDTFWATQQQIADAFGVTRQNITMHLQNIFREGELAEDSVCKESLLTGRDGKRYPTKLYNLNALISVGYRVGGKLGTAFRLWTTEKLIRYLTKGFVIDARRLKQPEQQDRVAELREIVRDIRASESNIYAELRRICSLCQDYDPASSASREFYSRMQAKLYWATVSATPAMVLKDRANAAHPNMGLISWSKQEPLKADAVIAKNYLASPELRELNRLTTILLDVFDDQLEIGRLTMMSQASDLLDKQLSGLNRLVLKHGGNISHDAAERHVDKEYKTFDTARRERRALESQRELAALKALNEELARKKRKGN